MPVANATYNKASLPSYAPLGEMFQTKDTNELYVGTGQSIVPAVLAVGPGMTFYADAANGNDSNSGTSPAQAFASLTAALAACVSGRGDTIIALPGSYNESITVDKDYVTLAGPILGGYSRPDITGLATITGQGFAAVHCRFVGDTADAVVQQGNGFVYSDCVFDGDGTSAKAGVRLLPSSTDDGLTASEGKIMNSLFRGSAIGIAFDTGAAPVGVGSTDNLIQGNRFYSNTLDLATKDSGSALYSVQVTDVIGNYFADKNKATYVDLTTVNGGAASAQTGTIMGNFFAIDKGPAADPTTTQFKMVGTGFTFAGNWGTVGALDGSGLD